MSVSDESRLFSLKALIEHGERPTVPEGPAQSEIVEDIIDLSAPTQNVAETRLPPLIIPPLGLSAPALLPTNNSLGGLAPANPPHPQRAKLPLLAAALTACSLAGITAWALVSNTPQRAAGSLPPEQTISIAQPGGPSPELAESLKPAPVRRAPAAQATTGDPASIAPTASTKPPQAAPPQRNQRQYRAPPFKRASPSKRQSSPEQAPKPPAKRPDPCSHCQAGDLGCHIKCRASG